MSNKTRFTSAMRQVVGVLVCTALVTATAGLARATELIPSIGVTKSTDSNGGDAKGFIGIAIRAPLMPVLNVEGGIGYRQDSFASNSIKVRQWPVSASLWVLPIPELYAGGGIGWYRTTFDYASNLPVSDFTTSKMGAHIGGGGVMPLTPQLGLDLNGRYIFMQKDDSSLEVPTTFNPDYWSLSVGLAIKF
jgi:hypothetical protein